MYFLAPKSPPVQRPLYSYCFIFLHWMTSKPWINTSNQHFHMDFYPPRKPANLKRQKSFCATFYIYFYIIGAHFPRQQVVAHCQIHPLILQLPMMNTSKHPEEELCFDKYQSSLPKKTIDLSFAPRILAHNPFSVSISPVHSNIHENMPLWTLTTAQSWIFSLKKREFLVTAYCQELMAKKPNC